MEAANRRGRLQTEDLLYVIRHDEKKLARCMELLEMNEQLKEARRNLTPPTQALLTLRTSERRFTLREARIGLQCGDSSKV